VEGGAVFTVELPVIAPAGEEQEAAQGGADAGAPAAGRRNILVVDDEEAIIDILFELLRADGHRVDTAVNGEVAWRKIRSQSYDLIISDLRMPGMGGRELYQRIREWKPSVCRRMIFSTGDVLSGETLGFLDDNVYLQKPFELDTVRQAVNSLLEKLDAAAEPQPIQ
jgi:CheY-like chemotaxis protein